MQTVGPNTPLHFVQKQSCHQISQPPWRNHGDDTSLSRQGALEVESGPGSSCVSLNASLALQLTGQ